MAFTVSSAYDWEELPKEGNPFPVLARGRAPRRYD